MSQMRTPEQMMNWEIAMGAQSSLLAFCFIQKQPIFAYKSAFPHITKPFLHVGKAFLQVRKSLYDMRKSLFFASNTGWTGSKLPFCPAVFQNRIVKKTKISTGTSAPAWNEKLFPRDNVR
jgi:hypothetical protein